MNSSVKAGHDPLGRCVKRFHAPEAHPPGGPAAATHPATYFYYDGWKSIDEGPGYGVSHRRSAFGPGPDEMVSTHNLLTGRLFYHHYDARGHCIFLSDWQSGDLLEQYEYDAFGAPYLYNPQGQRLPGDSVYGNRFLFQGKEWLRSLRLYDSRHRLYHYISGRFLQPDPKHFAAGDYNLYRYCHNDPVNKSDPLGLKEQVYLYSEPADVPGGQLASRWFGVTHQWLVIKDDGRTVWAGGLGTARGVPGTHNQTAKDLPGVKTYVVDHRGRENSPNARGMPVEADPDSVRAVMPIGARAGRYIPGVNDCNILARNALRMSAPLQPQRPSGPQQSCVSAQPTPPEPPRIWDNKPISTKGWWRNL